MEKRVQVRRSGFAGSSAEHGKYGWATYAGKSSRGEDVYRVAFKSLGGEYSAKFVASDLRFVG